MAVERVADIFPVGNALDNTVFITELLNLQTAEVFCGCAVNGIQIAVLFLEFIDLGVDMLHNLQGKLSVFH